MYRVRGFSVVPVSVLLERVIVPTNSTFIQFAFSPTALRVYPSLKQLAVNGADLIAAGRTPGVGLGETLEYLLEQVLEHPEWNNKEMLLKLAGQPDCPGREDAKTGQKTE